MTLRLSEWRTRAACRGQIHLDFIDPRTATEATECRALCAGCPVREQCLAEALSTGEAWGIWGGVDADERERIAEREGLPLPAVRPPHGTNPRYAKHGCRCDSCRQAHTAYDRARRARRRQEATLAEPLSTSEGQYMLALDRVG